MIKLFALFLSLATLQCSSMQSQESIWIGTFSSGDGYSGESVSLLGDKSFRAHSFSCIVPTNEITGQWSESEDWIELMPISSEKEYSKPLLRYRKCRFEGEYVLLKGGDEEMLAQMGPNLKWALWKGGFERKKRFLEEREEWFELIGIR